MPNRKAKLKAYIDEHSKKKESCMICASPTLKAEIKDFEDLLREKGERMPISAIWRWLSTEKLVTCQVGQFSKNLQRPCHREFYNYLKGRE